ncbi:glycosyltransferase family 4 protein [uncultured Limnobacter sp.]|uniref:glycosyltransferase n=1 Tax=uncultured Limnobacter sp. TaxID=199681 RepID=UPI0030FCDE8C
MVTNLLKSASVGGRELLCKVNYDALYSLHGDDLVVIQLSKNESRSKRGFKNAFLGHIDGLNNRVISEMIQTLRDGKVTKVFVDGSNLGAFVESLKQTLPNVEVITFFHNSEARFFLGSVRQKLSVHALGVLFANYVAERKSVRCSDKIICLNQRDSRILKRLYGRGATHIAPLVLEDRYVATCERPPESFALFVGGAFYANVAGIEWFIHEVVPHIHLPIYIVGRGFEVLREKLEIPGKVFVVGPVDDLTDWYSRAQFVIAPIFDGSGMKTKVAEALMYGKKVVGTSEAFMGYEDVAGEAGWLCDSSDEFVAAITVAQLEIAQSFYPSLRHIYQLHYSMDSGRKRLSSILADEISNNL